MNVNPQFDLVLERTTVLAPETIWRLWTETDLLMKWFCPRPWQTTRAELELRPGGRFMTVMKSPEGQEFPNEGCVLQVEKQRKLVFTSALRQDFRPAPKAEGPGDLPFTAVILLEPQSSGTKYTAIAIHRDESDRETHERMGFREGWGMAFDQLIEVARGL